MSGRDRAARGRPGDRERSESDALLAELDALYREVDTLYAGHGCPSSTECCRFGITGREPYVTSLELERIERAIARRGGKPPAKRPAPLEHRGLPLVRDERACPLLGHDGRCSIYADRPFGCRTFWCERATADATIRPRDRAEPLARLKALAARHRPGGDEGRPLTRCVGTSEASRRRG